MSDAIDAAVVDRKPATPRATSNARAADEDRRRDRGTDRPPRLFFDRTVSERFRPSLFSI